MTILLADDNTQVRRTIVEILSDLAPTFYECGDGDEAIEAYALHRPDWVVMDIRMPRVDGLTACRRIKAAGPAANIVVLTHQFPSSEPDARRLELHSGAI